MSNVIYQKRIKAKKVERVPQMDFLPYFRAGKINNDENYLPILERFIQIT